MNINKPVTDEFFIANGFTKDNQFGTYTLATREFRAIYYTKQQRIDINTMKYNEYLYKKAKSIYDVLDAFKAMGIIHKFNFNF